MIPVIRRIPAIRTATRRQIRFRTRRPGNGRKEVPTVIQVIALLTLMFFLWIVAVYATVREEPEEKRISPEESPQEIRKAA